MAAPSEAGTLVRPATISPLDDDVFIIYQWAAGYQVPISFLYVNNPRNLPMAELTVNEVKNIQEIYVNIIQRTESLASVARELSLSETTTAMIYARLVDPNFQPNNVPLFNIINSYFQEVGFIVYRTMNAYENGRQTWEQNFNRDQDRVIKIVRDILEDRTQLLSVQPYPRITLQVNRISIIGHPIWELSRAISGPDLRQSKSLVAEDGLDLFNFSQVSSGVPYIQYNIGEEVASGIPLVGRRQILGTRISGDLISRLISGSTPFIPKTTVIGQKEPKRSLFKLYRSDVPDSIPDYDIIIRDENRNNRSDTFYLTVWSGTGNMAKAAKDTFIPVEYFIDLNLIQIAVPVRENQGETLVQEKVFDNMPLRVNDWQETKVNGDFYILGLMIDVPSLLHLILIEPILNSYFYIEESEKPSAQKTRLYLHFRYPLETLGIIQEGELSSAIRLNFRQHTATGDETFSVPTAQGTQTVTLQSGQPYVQFTLFDAPSRANAEKIITLVSYLFSHYVRTADGTNLRDVTINFYRDLIPELAPTAEITGVSEPVGEDIITPDQRHRLPFINKHKLLRRVAPEVFVTGYSTDVQRPSQPIPIRREDIEAWINTTFQRGLEVKQRQVMSYPPGEEKYFFVCPDDALPYPGVKKNELSNKDAFEYIPHCYNTDHMHPLARSDYNVWYRGAALRVKGKKAEQYKSKTIRILEPNRFGPLPNVISHILSVYDIPDIEYQRWGVPLSPNSFLHCVLLGIGEPNYANAPTVEAREEIVRRHRNHMAVNSRAELLAQENYDESADRTLANLANVDLFFDPARFYRVVEETYRINIFVFTSKIMDDQKEEVSRDQLEIPRHREFYVRIPRSDRGILIIYKHQLGKERRGVETPAQCELIIRRQPKQGRIYPILYNPDTDVSMIINLFQIFRSFSSTLEWTSRDRAESEGLISRNLVVQLGLVSSDFRNFPALIRESLTGVEMGVTPNFELTHQLLDDYGKTRSLVAQVSLPATSGPLGVQPAKLVNVIVIIPPAQPLNLPTWTGDSLPTYQDVVQFLSTGIMAITYLNQDKSMVDGLWYPAYGRRHVIYVPIQPVRAQNVEIPNIARPLDIQSILETPTEELSQINRVRKLDKINQAIIRIIQWLFVLSGSTVDNFIANFLSSGREGNRDSISIYQMQNLHYRLPTVASFTEALAYLSQRTTGLVRNNRVYLYSEKYYRSIAFFLQQYHKETSALLPKLPTVIPGIYRDETDFIARDGNLIFLRGTDLISWLESLQRETQKNAILRVSLDRSLASYVNPYLFRDPIVGVIYLIQNVPVQISEEDETYLTQEALAKKKRGRATRAQVSTIPTIVPTPIQPMIVPGPVLLPLASFTTNGTEVVVTPTGQVEVTAEAVGEAEVIPSNVQPLIGSVQAAALPPLEAAAPISEATPISEAATTTATPLTLTIGPTALQAPPQIGPQIMLAPPLPITAELPTSVIALPLGGPTEAEIHQEIETRQRIRTIASAVHIAQQWQLTRVNLGYKAQPLLEDEMQAIPYIIYGISSSQLPIVEDNQSQGNDNPHRILHYGQLKYAAMLSLPG